MFYPGVKFSPPALGSAGSGTIAEPYQSDMPHTGRHSACPGPRHPSVVEGRTRPTGHLRRAASQRFRAGRPRRRPGVVKQSAPAAPRWARLVCNYF